MDELDFDIDAIEQLAENENSKILDKSNLDLSLKENSQNVSFEVNNNDKSKPEKKDENYNNYGKTINKINIDKDSNINKSHEPRSRSISNEKEKENEKYRIGNDIEDIRNLLKRALREDRSVALYRLNYKADEKDIFNFFAEANVYGIIDIKFVRDKHTRRSKGVAYVEFEKIECTSFALCLNGTSFMGHNLIIKPVNTAKKTLFRAYEKYDNKRDNKEKIGIKIDKKQSNKIYVGGLEDSLQFLGEDELRILFQPYGEIYSVEMPKDQKSGKSVGYAFIEFCNPENVKEAISRMHGLQIKGKILRVAEANDDMILVGSKYGNINKEIYKKDESQEVNEQIKENSIYGNFNLTSRGMENQIQNPNQNLNNTENIEKQMPHGNQNLINNNINIHQQINFPNNHNIHGFQGFPGFINMNQGFNPLNSLNPLNLLGYGTNPLLINNMNIYNSSMIPNLMPNNINPFSMPNQPNIIINPQPIKPTLNNSFENPIIENKDLDKNLIGSSEVLLCLKNICTKEDSKNKGKREILLNDYSFYFNSFGEIKDIKIHSNSLYIEIDLKDWKNDEFIKKKNEMIDGLTNKNINGQIITVVELTKDDFFPS